MTLPATRDLLVEMFQAAVHAADPAQCIARHLPPVPKGRTIVIGAGKGAAQMARALEDLWPTPLSGVVVTRYGYGCATRNIQVVEAAHPVPDEAGLRASQQLKSTIADLGPDDLVIALICGGGSALLPDPLPGLTLQDEIAVNTALLASGAPIAAMNALRKRISGIKGGRLAALTRARIVSLVVSDIPGDDPADVASGPTVPSTPGEIDSLLRDFQLDLPPAVLRHLADPASMPPLPSDPIFARNEVHVIASSAQSLLAAAELARARGVPAVILGSDIQGEARDVAAVHAGIAREILRYGRPFAAPVILLSGGETTVTLRSATAGRGGRNAEFALAFATHTAGLDVTCLAADTDGIDGTETNAGAFTDGTTIQRLRKAGLDPAALLSAHDSHAGFTAVGDLFITGPTGTNVNDFRAIAVHR